MSRAGRPDGTHPRSRANAAPPPAGVRGNDWRSVAVEAHRAFVPKLPLSVVVPCYQARAELALTLAALERQSYPRSLFEVVVVDDGSAPPLSAPASPLDVRVVRQRRRGFGLARARNRGVRAALHDIVVFLDGDVLAEAGLLAAHARWHHAVADAVTLGFCAYVSADGVDAAAIRTRRGSLAELFAERPHDPPWTERHMARTADLTVGRDDLFRAVVGNNFGVRRAFFEEVGGFDGSFDRYGAEDTEFGFRAHTRGGLLVPERGAMGWHQGRFAPNRGGAKRGDVAAQRAMAAGLIAHPDFRSVRRGGGWPVPRTVVTVDAAGCEAACTARTVDCLLGDGDVAVLVDPGTDGPVAEPGARLAGDSRVRVAPAGDALDAFPASPFHVALSAGSEVGAGLLERLRTRLGGAAVGAAVLPDGSRAVIARAWALHRARRGGGGPADYGEAVRFRVGAGELRGGLASILQCLPAASRPLRRVPRVLAEGRRVRDLADARRFVKWLAAGARWRLRTRRGLGRTVAPPPAPARKAVPSRIAGRPRELVALAARRALRGRAADLSEAAGLALAAWPPHQPQGVALRWLVRALRRVDRPLQLARLAARRTLRGRAADLSAAAGLVLAARRSRDPYAVAARRLARTLRVEHSQGRRRPDGTAALLHVAGSPARAGAAAEIAAALARGDRDAALSMAQTAARGPDRRAEKLVSHRYRFVWIANPKAASRSLIAALHEADPDAVVVRQATLAEVYAAFPEAREYLSLAFVRDPVARARSCHDDKVARFGNVALDVFHGLHEGMDLDAFAAWLATPWGSDAFADRHWLSQDVLLREAEGGPLPQFLGRFENLAADVATVAERLGLPAVTLPHLNRRPAPGPCPPSAVVRAALSRRYAADFALGGYAPVGTDGNVVGRAPARGGIAT